MGTIHYFVRQTKTPSCLHIAPTPRPRDALIAAFDSCRGCPSGLFRRCCVFRVGGTDYQFRALNSKGELCTSSCSLPDSKKTRGVIADSGTDSRGAARRPTCRESGGPEKRSPPWSRTSSRHLREGHADL